MSFNPIEWLKREEKDRRFGQIHYSGKLVCERTRLSSNNLLGRRHLKASRRYEDNGDDS